MSMAKALDLASSVGGKIAKEEVITAVDKYEKYHGYYGGDEKERKANYSDMVNKYFDLVTSFYEYGWGESFHFASRWKGESLKEGIRRHEHFIALQLGLKPGQKELNRKAGVDKTCDYVQADFMKMPFPNNSFDAAYALEATCHAPDAVGVYKEIHRVLKPGQCFAAYEWCMTNSFDPNNQEHQDIKTEIELGNGLTDIRTKAQCLEALEQVGFELMALEYVGIAPKGSQRVQAFLEKAAEGLSEGGRGRFKQAFYPRGGRDLWKFNPVLEFSSVPVSRAEVVDYSIINHCLSLYIPSRIEKLIIVLNVGHFSRPNIADWVDFAIAKHVRSL
ncbi:hypothetical protein Vadar_010461 [Vaccinium darrowii]|uniref:Uncharacterized protein n=1 Tax=Vaccinium darrowii TaxID=229202 RepID=A0ACB7ZJT6_9ERIC|nr:hypothetical protein Vadar_010461 [Vaccinium darrowii]